DMKKVYRKVDQAMLDRTVSWMLAHRDGNGGFTIPQHHLHTWSVSSDVVNAYVVLAMVGAGHGDAIGAEIDAQAAAIANEQDPYMLALRTMALLQVPRHKSLA